MFSCDRCSRPVTRELQLRILLTCPESSVAQHDATVDLCIKCREYLINIIHDSVKRLPDVRAQPKPDECSTSDLIEWAKENGWKKLTDVLD
jgi:hypothetical protein